jgi:hypothetical protein
VLTYSLLYSALLCCRLPQIILNVLKDADPRRPAFSTQYIVGMTVTRLLVPVYLHGWGDNYLHLRPNLLFCVVLVVYALAQMGVVLAQQKYGAILPWMAPLVPAKVTNVLTNPSLPIHKRKVLLAFLASHKRRCSPFLCVLSRCVTCSTSPMTTTANQSAVRRTRLNALYV